MLQAVVNALLLGSLYGIMAEGFSLMWGVINILNIAAGTLIVVGAYATYVLLALVPGANVFLLVPLVFAVTFLFGAVIQKVLYNRMVRGGLRRVLLLTFGLNMLLIDLLLLFFKANYRQINPSHVVFQIGGLFIPSHRIVIFIVAWLFFFVTYIIFRKTKIGLIIRATALNTEAAEICGIKISRVYVITTGIAVGLGGVAGALAGTILSFSPFEGAMFLAKCFVISIIGGLGNVMGAMVGGLIFALAEGIGGWYLGSQWQACVGLALLYIVLILKPEGLLAKKS